MGRGNNSGAAGNNKKREGSHSSFERDFGFMSSFSHGDMRSLGGPAREMHTAKCADCSKECQVPFKPIEGRPVYCRECYPKHKKF